MKKKIIAIMLGFSLILGACSTKVYSDDGDLLCESNHWAADACNNTGE